MKVCHLTSVHFQNDTRIFYKEATSLANHFDVSFLVVNGNDSNLNGVNIIGVPVNYKGRLSRFTKAVNVLYKAALELDADVYHFHDPELLRIAKKLKRKGKIVVYDVHEDLPRQILSKPYLNKSVAKFLSGLIEYYENKIAKKLDLIVTATPHIKERFIAINPNTIDVNNYPILDELLSDFPYEKKEGNSICYVGGITETRGIREIVNALDHTDANLLLAGVFNSDSLAKDVSKYSGWNSVEALGFLNRSEVSKVYENSKLGLVTLHPIKNYLDALPVKMFEYMASGLPVIASNFPLWRNIVEDNGCGFCVDPMDSHAIAKAINTILDDPKKAKKMGEIGKALVVKHYNWANEFQKLLVAYKEFENH